MAGKGGGRLAKLKADTIAGHGFLVQYAKLVAKEVVEILG